jgi:hypothetical protein
MLDRDSEDYFRRRERAERAAAKRAANSGARRAHQELAQGYAELLHGISSLSEARG